jgi:hypothetical protein
MDYDFHQGRYSSAILEIKHDEEHYSYSVIVVSPKQKGITRAYLNKSPHGFFIFNDIE